MVAEFLCRIWKLHSDILEILLFKTQQTIERQEMQNTGTGDRKACGGRMPERICIFLLNDSCLILIAPFDIFGRGLYRYTFEGICRECPDLKLEDGAVRVFINTKGKNPEKFSNEFLDFMKYITRTTDEAAENTSSKRIKLIHRNVRRVKESERMGVKYMQAWEEKALEREEGRAEGRAEGEMGIAKTLIKTVEAAMRNFKLDLRQACEGLGTTVEEYHRAKTQLQNQKGER